MHRRRTIALLTAILAALLVGAPAAEAAPAPCSAGYVGITFDDGPTSSTPALLDALKAAGIRAVFFNTGYHEQARQDVTRRQRDEGHQPGDHTMNHPFLDQLGYERVRWELSGPVTVHRAVTGQAEYLFRPPYGRTGPNIRGVARELGLLEVLWTVDTRDWAGAPAEQVAANALAVRPGGIVLLHDGYQATIDAVPAIAAGLRERGLCAGKVVYTPADVTAWTLANGTRVTFHAVAVRW